MILIVNITIKQTKKIKIKDDYMFEKKNVVWLLFTKFFYSAIIIKEFDSNFVFAATK